jgi:hypothetical protein
MTKAILAHLRSGGMLGMEQDFEKPEAPSKGVPPRPGRSFASAPGVRAWPFAAPRRERSQSDDDRGHPFAGASGSCRRFRLPDRSRDRNGSESFCYQGYREDVRVLGAHVCIGPTFAFRGGGRTPQSSCGRGLAPESRPNHQSGVQGGCDEASEAVSSKAIEIAPVHIRQSRKQASHTCPMCKGSICPSNQ